MTTDIKTALAGWKSHATKRGIPTDPLALWRYRVDKELAIKPHAHPFPTDCKAFTDQMLMTKKRDLEDLALSSFRMAKLAFDRWYPLVLDDYVEHRQLLHQWEDEIRPDESERARRLLQHLSDIAGAYRYEPVPWWPPFTVKRHSVLVAMRQLAEAS